MGKTGVIWCVFFFYSLFVFGIKTLWSSGFLHKVAHIAQTESLKEAEKQDSTFRYEA